MTSRILLKDNYILVTNFKVMFSSINSIDTDCKVPDQIGKLYKQNLGKYKIIFFYRKDSLRIISNFLLWCVKFPFNQSLDYSGNKEGFLMEILAKEDKFNYGHFKDLCESKEDNNLIEAFKLFLNVLDKIQPKNEHLHHQKKILNRFNQKSDILVDIDNEDDIKKCEHLLGISIPKKNSSDLKQKKLLVNFLKENQEYQKIIDDIYGDIEKKLKFNLE